MTSLERDGFVGLWLSRMEISEGVGGVKTGSDTSRTKFFKLTHGQLLHLLLLMKTGVTKIVPSHPLLWVVNGQPLLS